MLLIVLQNRVVPVSGRTWSSLTLQVEQTLARSQLTAEVAWRHWDFGSKDGEHLPEFQLVSAAERNSNITQPGLRSTLRGEACPSLVGV